MQVLSVLIVVFAILATACTGDGNTVPLMTCHISRHLEDCTSSPSLTNGKLRLMQGGHFELDGRYQSCAGETDISIHGKHRGSTNSGSLRIELLATKVKGLKSSPFISTIAVVRLNEISLKGLISNVWASIGVATTATKYNEETVDLAIACVHD